MTFDWQTAASVAAVLGPGLLAHLGLTKLLIFREVRKALDGDNGKGYVSKEVWKTARQGCRAELLAKIEALKPQPDPTVIIEGEAILDAIARARAKAVGRAAL